jgi:hypothetical protein
MFGWITAGWMLAVTLFHDSNSLLAAVFNAGMAVLAREFFRLGPPAKYPPSDFLVGVQWFNLGTTMFYWWYPG